MKKIIIPILVFLFLVGCTATKATPKSAVEDMLKKYQSKDDIVMSQLDEVISGDTTYNDTQREEYKKVIERQYTDLTYDIKDDEINGDNATVTVEIEVYDYSNIEITDPSIDLTDADAYNTAKIKMMKDTKERVKYTLELTVTKDGDEWKVDNLTDIERKKIHGLY